MTSKRSIRFLQNRLLNILQEVSGEAIGGQNRIAKRTFASQNKASDGNWTYRRQKYEEAFELSIKNPESYWAEQAEKLVWFKKWDRVLDDSNRPFTKW